jgi:hypothetical protein
MRKGKAVVVIGCVFVLMVMLISGCATIPFEQQAKSIWPSPIGAKWYWYRPEMLSSAEEAMGTLRNLQQSFVEFAAGQNFKTFDLDKYGLRTKWEWTETTQYTQYVPNSGGYWVGGHYQSYYGGSYQPSTQTSQHEGAFVIPFAEVSSLEIYSYPDLDRNYKWSLHVYLDNKDPVYLRAPDEKTVKQLGNAIATLSREQGRIIKFTRFGSSTPPLTPEQSAELALQPGTGLLVHDVAVGSPAEKVGLRFLDVILEVDGQPVKDVNELHALSENKKSVNLKILRRGKITDATGNTSLQKTELSLPVNLE